MPPMTHFLFSVRVGLPPPPLYQCSRTCAKRVQSVCEINTLLCQWVWDIYATTLKSGEQGGRAKEQRGIKSVFISQTPLLSESLKVDAPRDRKSPTAADLPSTLFKVVSFSVV